MDSSSSGSTSWNTNDPTIKHLLYSFKASYHVGEYITGQLKKLDPEKFDFYINFFYGKNTIMGDVSNENQHITAISDARLGYGFGARYMYNKKLSFYLEGGVSDYGKFNFGLTYKLSDMTF